MVDPGNQRAARGYVLNHDIQKLVADPDDTSQFDCNALVFPSFLHCYVISVRQANTAADVNVNWMRAAFGDNALSLSGISRLLPNVRRVESRLVPLGYWFIEEEVEYAVPTVIAADLQGVIIAQALYK